MGRKFISLLLVAIMIIFMVPEMAVVANSIDDSNTSYTQSNVNKVVDNADLLSESEEIKLENKLTEIITANEFDMVIVSVKGIEGNSIKNYADDFYDNNGYGYGTEHDGCLLLVDMENREWWISTCGFGITAFTISGINYIGEQFSPKLTDAQYYKAFNIYASLCEDFLVQAKSGTPYDEEFMPASYDDEALYLEFLDSMEYLEKNKETRYVGAPYKYAFLDIDQNGVSELLVLSIDGSGFTNTDIYTIDDSEVVYADSIYCYAGISYASDYKGIKYCYPRPSAMDSSYTICEFIDNKLKSSVTFCYKANANDKEYWCYFYDENGERSESTQITEKEWEAYATCSESIKARNLYSSTDDGFSYVIKDNCAIITGYSGHNKEGIVSIPSEIKGYPVTGIEQKSFFTKAPFIKKVYIPATVTEVGYDAFEMCYDLTDVYYDGTQTQWGKIEIDESNKDLTEATLHTSFDSEIYKHGYAKIIYEAIEKSKSLYPYSTVYGHGFIQDIDSNGTYELVMVYSKQGDNEYINNTVYSVYTLNGNIAVPVVENEVLLVEVGGPQGKVSLATKDGKRYLTAYNETGTTSPENLHRYGEFNVYVLDGDQLVEDAKASFDYYVSESTIDYDRSTAVLNGKAVSYSDYEEFKNSFTEEVSIQRRNSVNGMTLTELLEYTKEIPIKESANNEWHNDFTLGRDNNSYLHADFNQCDSDGNVVFKGGFVGVKNYDFTTASYEKLTENASFSEKLKIIKKVFSSWGGSCYGIASTMCLDYSNELNLNSLFNATESYYELGSPCENIWFLDAVQYYQLSQYLKNNGVSEDSYYTCDLHNAEKTMALDSFLEKLVNTCRDNSTVVFGMLTSDSGHAIVACGYKYDKENKKHIIRLYDENSVEYNNPIGEFSEMYINDNYSDFSFSENMHYSRNSLNTIFYVDICENKIVDSPIPVSAGYEERIYVSVDADACFEIINANGEKLSYDGTYYTGDMKVYSIQPVVNTEDIDYIYEIDYSDYINYYSASSEDEFEVYDHDSYYSVSVSGLDYATVKPDDGVDLYGNSLNFSIYANNCAETIEELVAFFGIAENDVYFTNADGFLLDSSNNMYNVSINEMDIDGIRTIEENISDSQIIYDNSETSFEIGDVNMDGKINIRDATAIQKCLAKIIKLDEDAIELADFDMNSKVNVKDATAIQKYIAGIK